MTPQEVLDAFVEETRGDGGDVDTDGTIVLETVRGVFVFARKGAEGWWTADLHIPQQGFSVPLLQGPVWYEDSDTTVQDVVTWLRQLCDASADLDDDDIDALAEPHDCNEHAVPYTSDGPLGHGWECGRCGAFLQAG